MGKERNTFPVAVHLVMEKDGKLLLLRRFNTGYEDGKYSLVAGHLEGGETVQQAASREAREEIGIAVAPEQFEVVLVMHRKSAQERVDFFVKPSSWKGEPHNAEPSKCDELAWFDKENIPKNTIPYVRAALDHIAGGEFFAIFGWPQ